MFIQGGRRPPCMNMWFSLKPTPAVAPAAFGLLDLATGLRLLAPAPPAQIFVFFLLVVHILFLIDGAEIHIGNVLILHDIPNRLLLRDALIELVPPRRWRVPRS